MIRVRLKFAKEGRLIYISHLDLIRSIERTLRRARVKVALTEGFHPRPKISYGPPLPIGISSESEYLDINLDDAPEMDELLKGLNSKSPAGLRFLEASLLGPKVPQISKSVRAAKYSIRFEASGAEKLQLETALSRLLSSAELTFPKKGSEKTVKTKEAIFAGEIEDQGGSVFLLSVVLSVGSVNDIRADSFGDLFLAEILPKEARIIDIRRLGLYAKIFDGFFKSYE
ncbi:MAG: TIGR03936 family radical SAM-associated protein [Actinomycetota bacterium]|nr:TIGR03936 family radical SAM-associated protein [Actinomycetota bacterium]